MVSPVVKTLLRVTLLGALTGLLAGLAVLVFRWVIETGQSSFLPGGVVDNFEALPAWARLALPVGGGLVVGLVFQFLPPAVRQVGVVHVLASLQTAAGGRLPLKNALVQFFFGAAAIVTGQSVGREGPGVHLGSTCGSLVAARARLTRRDSRTLIACGAAASVAAAFNTPLAGAIFGIEVLRFRYHIARFMPVAMAAVIGAVVIRVQHGASPAFPVPPLGMESVLELPLVALLGLATGGLAGLYTVACERVARRAAGIGPLLGFTAAGAITGLLALVVPQIMGVGYDTVNLMLNNQVAAHLLLAIVACKLLATAVTIGCRVPGGLIGPTLVIGGAMGALLHFVIHHTVPGETGSSAFYAVIGMMAMMGAVLQAPLAALIALLELTGTPTVILPGMMAVFAADLMARLIMGQESAFVALLRVLRPGQGGEAGLLD